MLFNSLVFILIFLPIVLSLYLGLEYLRKPAIAIIWLFITSLFFYAWWNWPYVLLLLGSIIGNYWLGKSLTRWHKKSLLIFAVSANLLLIGYYKYHNFFLENLNYVSGLQLPYAEIFLPLGISFFTFQQIAFLIDIYRKQVQVTSFSNYALFISFFPQLIAGPIVHYQEIVPQMGQRRSFTTINQDLQIGLTIFLIGLFKKFAIADTLAIYASPIFVQADSLVVLDGMIAWRATFAYAFQIYFDFSGYSDMAIGLGRLFGFRLPLNFFSPYKALNISDFWRCWHITLSRFLRDYLYIPLGGNKKGQLRLIVNLLTVMFLGGLWHGAGWNFIIWGMLHGFYLACYHGFNNIRCYLPNFPTFITQLAAWFITFIAICIAWVFFRAETLPGALHMLQAMFDFNSWYLTFQIEIDIYLLLTALVIIFLPNTWQLMQDYSPSITLPPKITYMREGFRWQFNVIWALFAGLLLAIIIILMVNGQPTEFIYFQF
ncbi:MAG: MBOAT family protein [Candidatus Marithrix sp.]|nr:MBOAT family protein [Candidatus Marithrix sp.]